MKKNMKLDSEFKKQLFEYGLINLQKEKEEKRDLFFLKNYIKTI